MKYGEMNVACHSYKKWKNILREELELASTFEIHCWQDEIEWISLALQYGEKKKFFGIMEHVLVERLLLNL